MWRAGIVPVIINTLKWSFSVTVAWSFTQLQLIGVMLKNSILGAITFSFVALSD